MASAPQRTNSPFLPTIPQVSTPLITEDGSIAPAWHQLLIKLWQNVIPGSALAVVVAPSPTSYIARTNGTLVVQGLTGSATIARPPDATTYGVFAGGNGTIPLAAGDVATITYGGLPPTLTFLSG